MDIKKQHIEAVKRTRSIVKTAFDPMKVVVDYLISQFSMCSSGKVCFFVSKNKRTGSDIEILIRIIDEQQKKIGG